MHVSFIILLTIPDSVICLLLLFLFLFKEYEAARKKFVEIKTEKDKVKKRLEEVRRQNAPMQKRLDEVTKKVRELDEATREMVSTGLICGSYIYHIMLVSSGCTVESDDLVCVVVDTWKQLM